MSFSAPRAGIAADYWVARDGLAHRVRAAAILDLEGPDRVAFLHGQLTQDVRAMAPGQIRPTAGLTPRGKLIFIGRLYVAPQLMRLLLPGESRTRVLEHLRKYALFQKVSIADRTEELIRIGLYGRGTAGLEQPPAEALLLSGEGEFSAEILAPSSAREAIETWLRAQGSVPLSQEAAEALRVESGRPRFGQDADQSHLADEVGLEAAISTTKGCYVGQEIVARMRTYGRVNRRMVGLRFPDAPIAAGERLKGPEEAEPGKVEQGRVTSSVLSPAFGPIGLGYAFHEVPIGGKLLSADDPPRSALVAELPFATAS